MENSEHKELEEYLEARETQLNNVLSSPIGTGDYSMPSTDEVDETIFCEDEIEDTRDQTVQKLTRFRCIWIRMGL